MFWGYILLYSPYIGSIYGKYLHFRIPEFPLNKCLHILLALPIYLYLSLSIASYLNMYIVYINMCIYIHIYERTIWIYRYLLPSICLSVCLSMSIHVYLSICVSIYVFLLVKIIYVWMCPPIYLFLSIYSYRSMQSIYVSIYLSIYLYV